MPKTWIDCSGHGRDIKIAAEKFVDLIRERVGPLQNLVVWNGQTGETRLHGEPLFNLRKLALINLRKGFVIGGGLPLPLQHLSLAP